MNGFDANSVSSKCLGLISTFLNLVRVLQRTSISTNIKERLDFSCAIFGPDGGLVSNAPHIPVHLGAMQETVQYQIKVNGKFSPGDVILSNHPSAGGSHLPDLTVITPVFYRFADKTTKKSLIANSLWNSHIMFYLRISLTFKDSLIHLFFRSFASPQLEYSDETLSIHSETFKLAFFVASRGHHADIGGITPGSMPSHSTNLSQVWAIDIIIKHEFYENYIRSSCTFFFFFFRKAPLSRASSWCAREYSKKRNW